MGLLTRDHILAVADIQYLTVPIPEWGGDVRIRSMTAAARDANERWMLMQESVDAEQKYHNLRARTISQSVVGEDGELLFGEADIEALGKKSAAAMQRLYDAVISLNAISKKDIAELVKN